MASHPVSRRAALAALGGAAAGAALSGLIPGRLRAAAGGWSSGYVPDGAAGLARAFPLLSVRHELAGNDRALELAARLGDWVGWAPPGCPTRRYSGS
jgi:hypothetical protein